MHMLQWGLTSMHIVGPTNFKHFRTDSGPIFVSEHRQVQIIPPEANAYGPNIHKYVYTLEPTQSLRTDLFRDPGNVVKWMWHEVVINPDRTHNFTPISAFKGGKDTTF